MMSLGKYNSVMVLVFVSLNMVTEYSIEDTYYLRIVMLSFEVLNLLLELVCAVFAYFISNPVVKIVRISPDYKIITLHFCELLVVIIYLGLMHNSLTHKITTVSGLALLEMG